MSTQTQKRGFVWNTGLLGAVPAFSASITILTVLAAALLPFAVLAILVVFHVVTLVRTLRFARSAAERKGIHELIESECTLLLTALAVSIVVDSSAPWRVSLTGIVGFFAAALAIIAVLAPKVQLLKWTVLQSKEVLSVRDRRLLLVAFGICVLIAPWLLEESLSGLLGLLTEKMTSLRL